MSESRFLIEPASPLSEEVAPLLKRHWQHTIDHSPPGGCYTFTAQELAEPDVTFWTAREDGDVVGFVALKQRSDSFGELKSLHVAEQMRGSGLGQALVQTVIGAARAKGLTELGLETGRSEGFAASRRLYEREGFVHGPVFAPYECGTFSYCMTRPI